MLSQLGQVKLAIEPAVGSIASMDAGLKALGITSAAEFTRIAADAQAAYDKVIASPLPNNAWNGLYRLGIMSRFDVAKMGHDSPEFMHTFAESTKLAYAARLQYAGDRDQKPPPFEPLLSEKQFAMESAKIRPDKATPLTLAPSASPKEQEEYTTHFVIADSQGNVVTSTQTLGMLFGSKVMAPGTGIWLNNSMQYCTFEPKGNPLTRLRDDASSRDSAQ